MIVYINTNVDSKDNVIKHIAKEFGINRATGLVNNWYEEYSEVAYDSTNLNLVFFKKRYAGYWESVIENLEKIRINLYA